MNNYLIYKKQYVEYRFLMIFSVREQKGERNETTEAAKVNISFMRYFIYQFKLYISFNFSLLLRYTWEFAGAL